VYHEPPENRGHRRRPKKTFAAIAKSSLKGHVQPLGGEKVCLVKGVYSKSSVSVGVWQALPALRRKQPAKGAPCLANKGIDSNTLTFQPITTKKDETVKKKL